MTARRRSEDLLRTPLSVAAFDGAELEQRSVGNLADLQRIVPNLTLAPTQNVGDAAANVFIRGIGQEDFVAGTEAGVGLYVDGVYVGRTMGALLDLLDVARIEVLRGPQGTLYGRNTIGGAINVISEAPRQSKSRSLTLGAANFGRAEVKVALGAPLGERLQVRFAAAARAQDGYLRRLPVAFSPAPFTESDFRGEGADARAAARLQLRWKPSDSRMIDLALDHSHRRGSQAPTHLDGIDVRASGGNLSTVNRLLRDGVLQGPQIDATWVSPNLLESRAGGGNRIAQDVGGASATATQTVGDHALQVAAAYRQLRSDVATDLDGTYFNLLSTRFDERQRQYSLEFRAAANLARFDYVAGIFALRESAELLPVAGAGQDVVYACGCVYTPQTRPRTLFPQRRLGNASYAGYAEVTLPLAARLTSTLGARVSQDRKRVDAQLVLLDPDTLQPTDRNIATGSNRDRWTSVTWRAGLEFQATREALGYVSVAKGFRSGGFNVRPAINLVNLGLNAYDPETAVTFEAGVRTQSVGNRLRFNGTVFDTGYRGLQLRQQTVVAGVVTTLVENAARARIRGVEVDMAGTLGGGWSLGVALGALDPHYRDVGRVAGLTPKTPLQRSPRSSAAAWIAHERSFSASRLVLRADFSHRSREQFQLTPSPWDQPGFGLLGGRATWHGRQDRWSLAIFGTNLTDERYRVAGRASLLGQTGFAHSIVGMPRQIGVQLDLSL